MKSNSSKPNKNETILSNSSRISIFCQIHLQFQFHNLITTQNLGFHNNNLWNDKNHWRDLFNNNFKNSSIIWR
jgi:hypothetical protein